MRILGLILTTLVVGALCEEKCVPGSTFMEDCNRCRCGNDGQKACTRKMCPPNELSDEAQVRAETTPAPPATDTSSADEKDEVHLQTNGQVCIPNEIKMQDCNRCRCANNGIGWFCTRRTCPPREKRAAPAPCTPGTEFTADDGCNTCTCSADGRASCTRVLCAPQEGMELMRFRRSAEEPKCTPGTHFMRECNRCYCHENGLISCTKKGCIKQEQDRHRREVEKCTPGTSFKKDCNTCFCDDDGLVSCTKKGCITREKIEGMKQDGDNDRRRRRETDGAPTCTPGSKFKIDCNDCICTENGEPRCSMKFCPSNDVSAFRSRLRRSPQPEPKCTPGTTFKRDCNTCHCTAQGHAACTEKACLSNDRRRRSPQAEPKCTPGTTFKRDCNTCFCDEQGRAACTLIGCLPDQSATTKSKRQAADDLPRSEIAPGSPGFTCTPRASFKYQCNTCFCTDDGKNAGCTFKFCIPGEY